MLLNAINTGTVAVSIIIEKGVNKVLLYGFRPDVDLPLKYPPAFALARRRPCKY